MPIKPQIFSYTDYRHYLRELYEYLKKTQPAFSFRFFAKQAGFSSPNFLKLVIQGKRNLTADSVPKFIKALKLNKQEGDYFENLVFFNQAESPEDKNRFYKKITQNRRYREIRHLEKDQFNFYSHWYYSAVRELITQKTFIEDPRWIAKMLTPNISEKQAKQSLDLLLKLGLVNRNARGRLEQTDATITSGAEVSSLAAANFHREMLKIASQSITQVPSAERDISAVTIGIAADEVAMLKDKINQFRKDLLASLGGNDKATDRVYQLNLQLFPLTQKLTGTK